MSEEIQSLLDNHTWSLAELPPGRSAIGSRWTYRIKRSPDGSIERYKARFVAKGFSQRPGIDYYEIHSPVIKLDSLCVILSMAANRDLSVTQLDVKTVFLYGDVTEELYVRQPEGFTTPGKEKWVCRLHKGLYGLKQSSRLWNIKFEAFITKNGLTSTRSSENEFIILGIWVDDGLLCTNSSTLTVLRIRSVEMTTDILITRTAPFYSCSLSFFTVQPEERIKNLCPVWCLLLRPLPFPPQRCRRPPNSVPLALVRHSPVAGDDVI